MKGTPSFLTCFLVLSSWDKSTDLEGQVMARKKAAYHDSSFNGSEVDCPRFSMKSSTLCTFHVLVYLLAGEVCHGKYLFYMYRRDCRPIGID